MATTGDFVFLALVLAVIAALVLAFKPNKNGDSTVDQQRKNLKKMGIDFSQDGVSVKTTGRAMSQQEYIERTQNRIEKGKDAISKHTAAFSWGNKQGSQS